MKTPRTAPHCRRLPALIGALFAATAPAAFAADDSALETITVTAQARSQSEKEVPIAMQVIGVTQIESLAASNLADLNGYVPGLQVDGSQPTQPNFTIRGIGTGDFGIGTDAAVGVYVDGIYTGKTGGSLLNFNDVKRVEVLKGPQGTLFGRNSAAGAVSIVTNEPERATDATATLRLGQDHLVYADGMVNTALGDTVALRISGTSKQSSGWITNQTTGESMGGDGAWGTRVALKWAPGADCKLVTSWEHESLDQSARPAWGLIPRTPGTMPVFFSPSTYGAGGWDPNFVSGAEFVNPIGAPLRNDSPNRETRNFDGLTLRWESTFAGLQFTSNTGWRHFRSYNGEDNDGTDNPATNLNTINAERNTSLQQEFRLASKSETADWVGGASYFHSNAQQVSTVNSMADTLDTLFANQPGGAPLILGIDAALQAAGAPIPYNYGYGNSWSEQMVNSNLTTSYALYGDVIWHLDSSTNLTTGLRWTTDRKQVGWFVPPYAAPGLDAAFSAVTGQTFGQLAGPLITGVSGAVLTNVIFQQAALAASAPVSASHSWTDLSPRLVVDRKIGGDTMVYASVSKGYQAGGYDVFNPLARFEPEHMLNLEAGFKTSLPAVHGGIEGSVFRYKFTNLQNISLVNAGTVPVYDVTTSDQHALGVDLSANGEVARGVSVFGAAEYIDQRYDTYSYADHLTGVMVSLDGQAVGTPSLAVSAGVHGSWPLAGGSVEGTLQGTHSSATRCNTQIVQEFNCMSSGPIRTGVAQSRADLKLGWDGPEHRYGVAVFVNNLFNQQYLTGVGGQSAWTLASPYTSVTPPRFTGIEVHAGL